MAVINRRNAVVGWGTWEAGKWYVRKKAERKPSRLGNVWVKAAAATAALGAAALGAGLVVFRKR